MPDFWKSIALHFYVNKLVSTQIEQNARPSFSLMKKLTSNSSLPYSINSLFRSKSALHIEWPLEVHQCFIFQRFDCILSNPILGFTILFSLFLPSKNHTLHAGITCKMISFSACMSLHFGSG